MKLGRRGSGRGKVWENGREMEGGGSREDGEVEEGVEEMRGMEGGGVESR